MELTIVDNGRGALGLRLGSTLFLPSGRPVPAEDAFGWEEADAELDAVPAPCREAAEAFAAAAMADARAAVSNGPGQARAPHTRRSKVAESPAFSGGEAFAVRCEELVARAEDIEGERAEDFVSGVVSTLSGMAATARRIGRATPRMEDALRGCESGVSAWER